MNVPLRPRDARPWRLVAVLLWLMAGLGFGAAPLPPKPVTYVSDQAGLLDSATANALNLELERFERETSNQVVVATFPRLPEGEAMEDFTQRTAESWQVGDGSRNNGAVLFVFRDDRKLRVEVGYGLEGAIPDSVAARILANEIRPRLRAGDFSGGIQAGARALMAAARGEYTGTGTTVADRENQGGSLIGWLIFFLILFLIVHFWMSQRDTEYDRRGRRRVWGPVTTTQWPGPNWGGGGWGGGGGGGWSSGGGGTFSGGGGSFGGGGASGDW